MPTRFGVSCCFWVRLVAFASGSVTDWVGVSAVVEGCVRNPDNTAGFRTHPSVEHEISRDGHENHGTRAAFENDRDVARTLRALLLD
jgi:hypothetical protein